MGLIDLSPARYTVDIIVRNTRNKQSKRLYRAFYIVVEHHLYAWHHVLRAAPVSEMGEIKMNQQ
jgi:hypothetical protein